MKSKKVRTRMIFSEVVDSPESAREFLDMNNIKQKEIKCIIVVWEEKI